jgi:hypothetical protein
MYAKTVLIGPSSCYQREGTRLSNINTSTEGNEMSSVFIRKFDEWTAL